MLRLFTLRGSVQCLLVAATLAVCLQPLCADDAAATVLTLTGRVSLLRDNAEWALNIGDSVQPGKTIITGPDGFAEFKVSDGSTFQVFPNSRTVFRKNRSNWSDILDVVMGRVKVHIEKIGGQPNPNKVRTPTAVISVRGTTFDVIVEDEEATVVSVEEGQVVVENWQSPGPTRTLNAGESIRVFKSQPLAKVIDKGTIIQRTLKAAADVWIEIATRTPRSGGGTPPGGGSAPLPGDRDPQKPGGSPGGEAPPAPPPPPPPPPQ